MNYDPIFLNGPAGGSAKFENADSTTKKALFTAEENGATLGMIAISSDSDVEEKIDLFLNDGVNDIPLVRIAVPSGSGTVTGTPPVSVLTVTLLPWLNPERLVMHLHGGWILKAAAVAAITAGKTVHVIVTGGHY